jgi:tight adherence protein B
MLNYIIVIGGGAFLIIGVYLIVVGQSGATKDRIEEYITPAPENSSQGGSRTFFQSLRRFYNSFAGAIYSETAFRRLASANWPLTVAEYFLVRVVSLVLVFAICWALGQLVLGAILAFLTNYAFEFFISTSINRRKEKFKNQLVDVLVLISSSIRAGLSLPQAIEVVANEMAPPASVEFKRVKREVEIGLTLSQALINLSSRMQDDDLDIVVTAININIRAGGNLSKILDRIVETIRDRIRLLFETRALTSYARYTSLLLTFLPVVVAAIVYLISPNYFAPMIPPQASPIIVLIPVILILLGNLWLTRIGRSKA